MKNPHDAMSDTPRTDEVKEWHDCTNKHVGLYVYIDFARQLERELAAANARADASESARRDEESWWEERHNYKERAGSAEAQLAAARGQAERLRELLEQMLNVAENADETGYVTDCGFVDLDKLHATVRAALSAAPANGEGKP